MAQLTRKSTTPLHPKALPHAPRYPLFTIHYPLAHTGQVSNPHSTSRDTMRRMRGLSLST